MHHHRRKKSQGFTLMEILIAVFIFAIVAMIIASGINMALRAEEQITSLSDALAEIQLAETIITRDVSQIINRPIIDESGQVIPGIWADSATKKLLEFTRMGLINPQSTATRSTLQRVAYELDGDKLIRRTWRVLDRAPRTVSDTKVLLHDVTHVDVQWLVNGAFISAQGTSEKFPTAIKIEITQRNKKIMRIITLPGGVI